MDDLVGIESGMSGWDHLDQLLFDENPPPLRLDSEMEQLIEPTEEVTVKEDNSRRQFAKPMFENCATVKAESVIVKPIEKTHALSDHSNDSVKSLEPVQEDDKCSHCSSLPEAAQEALLPLTSRSKALDAFTSTSEYHHLSAVERARSKANHLALESIGGKRKSGSDEEVGSGKRGKIEHAEDDEDVEGSPESIHRKRYQRRLQKNRDTAYISRIRRRAYTKLLEESLTLSEDQRKGLASTVDALKVEVASLYAELRALHFVKSNGADSTDLTPASRALDRSYHSRAAHDVIHGMFDPAVDAAVPQH